MRKILQITGTSATDRNGGIEDRVFALCDDGTVWSSWFNYGNHAVEWMPMPPVPQDPNSPIKLGEGDGTPYVEAEGKRIYLESDTVKEEILARFKQLMNQVDQARDDQGWRLFVHDSDLEMWEFVVLLDRLAGPEV